jgi:hypothetical protein
MALDNGSEFIGTNLKPCSLDFFRDHILASKFEAWDRFLSVAANRYLPHRRCFKIQKKDGSYVISYYHV